MFENIDEFFLCITYVRIWYIFCTNEFQVSTNFVVALKAVHR